MYARNNSDPPLPQATPFELRILGPFELVDRQSGELIPVPAQKMRALFAYLAAAPRSTEARRRLAGLLWASSGEHQARQSMRQLLSNFRRGAAPHAAAIVMFDEISVGLDGALVSVDRAALMAARPNADVSELMRVADLYRSDFAQGLEIGEAEFDTWLQAERIRSQEAAIALFDRLVRALADLGRHDEALRRANRLAEIDPLREETHRLVISQEAIVSGRASAMQRYEAFRLLLRDEVGVRPEPATLHLLEQLRRQKSPDVALLPSTTPVGDETMQPIPPLPRAERQGWRRPALAAGLAAMLLIGGLAVSQARHTSAIEDADTDELADRAGVVLLPFEFGADLDDLRAQSGAYEAETKRVLARNHRLSLVDIPVGSPTLDPIALGRRLHASYVIKTNVAQAVGGAVASIRLVDTATGTSILTKTAPMTPDMVKFAQTVYQFAYPVITIDRAAALSKTQPDSTSARLWGAAAAEVKTGATIPDPAEFALYESVLEKDPNRLEALLGLANGLMLRVARDQSRGVNRLEDLRRATRYVEQAKARSPNLAEIAFIEGMLDKVQARFVEADKHFENALRDDPDDPLTAAESAHVKMFLGRLDEAYRQVESIDVAAADAAFLAGETALIAGHPDRALTYFDWAVSGNPEIPRNPAWRAVALWRLDRKAEAHEAAVKSQKLEPPYLPYWMAQRGNLADKRYRDARDLCVEDFKQALAYTVMN